MVVAMLVGSSVGSWRFTLGALCCLVTELATDVVRIHLCVIQVSFTVFLCSVAVHSRLNWVAIVIVNCSCDALCDALQ